MIVERTRWHELKDARLKALPDGGLLRMIVRKRPLLFVRRNGQLLAMLDHCPHQGAALSGGWLDGDHVVCPRHRFHFDPATGACRHGMTVNVPVFPVDESGDAVRVGFPHTTLRLFGIDLW